MRVCLLSEPSQCFDLPELDRRITVVRASAGDSIPDADVYIWNYTPISKLDAAISSHSDRQHLILAEPNQLDHLHAVRTSACILLKPVTPFTLNAFLDLALRNCELRVRPHKAETARFDRDRFAEYIQEINLALQRYDRERNNFLACAVHDLRTPLTAIHGYCGLLAQEKIGSLSAAQRELVERMQYSTGRLMRLTSGALGVVAEGRVANRRSYPEADIAEALERALHDIDPLVQEKSITIEVQLQPPDARMLFEPEQIQQVFVNLLENSCKFIPRNGTIEIHGYPFARATRLARDGRPADKQHRVSNGYRIDILDSGPGIPAELADKIFEPYSSFLQSPDRSAGGLGLAICRSILLAHQGMIWATPSAAGGCFSFVLPIQNAKGNSASTETTLELEEAAS